MNPHIAAILASLKSVLEALLAALPSLKKPQQTPPPASMPEPVPEPVPVSTPAPVAKYDWSTLTAARHSVRVICDEEGLDLEQKNTMCATIAGESGFDTHAKNYNYKRRADRSLVYDAKGAPIVLSIDWGICQWNDYYHGNEISPDEAVHNPEKAVRLMARYWKMGERYRRWWIAYKNGRYKQFL